MGTARQAMSDVTEGGKGGGKSEVGALLKEHAPLIGRVAMALIGDAPEVEGVLETVARMAGATARPADVSVRAWLLGLTRAACATQISRLPLRRTEHDRGPSTERLGYASAAPARAALRGLRPTEREAVVLSLVGGLEAAEVAAACNVDVGTAKARIARGLEQLMDESRKDTSGGLR
jgi:DNA-directed RNA polymerase specialized sigma24 family protein